ncbi:hypothetical protein OPIT5_03150 [Opitutaceae bacterium TAV5]|nr:hypothetical protein OPIT5_03150 [Opitutaceae bacterium TAV5]
MPDSSPASPDRPSAARRFFRQGWPWLAGLLLATMLVTTHWLLVRHYLDRITGLQLSPEPTERLRLPGIVPSHAADGMTWTDEIIEMADHGDFRLRTTRLDNAPEGRPVYWNSGWAWLHIAWARVYRSVADVSWPVAVEKAAAWINLPALLLTLAGYSFWLARRQGAVAGGLLALSLAGAHSFYEAFYPSYNDHHGITNIGLLALILGALLGGGGWVRGQGEAGAGSNSKTPPAPSSGGFLRLPDDRAARRAFLVSALGGGVALWINAVATVLAIGMTGFAGVLAAWAAGRDLRARGAICRPDLWRLWGRVGAATGFLFFLLEQFPDRLFGWRLEVNHPVYALAWLGGGELVALLLEWLENPQGSGPGPTTKPWRRKRAFLAGAAVAVVPLLFIVGRERVFMMFDPFMATVHHHILELRSLPDQFGKTGFFKFVDQGLLRPAQLLLAVVTLRLAWRRPAARLALVFCLAIALPMTLQGWWQTRWLQSASVPQSIAAVVMLCVWIDAAALTPRRRRAILTAVAIVAAALFLTMPARIISGAIRTEAEGTVLKGEAPFLLYRDIAAVLRNDRPDVPPEKIIVLTDPNASVAIGYFGGFATLGTFHWENGDGLRAAAQLMTDLCVGDPEALARAERLVRKRGVTHVAWITTSGYTAGYWQALYPGKPLPKRDELGAGNTPVWLRPIPYATPPVYYQADKELVRLYAVDFSQTEAEARYRAGLAAAVAGRPGEAERRFAQARDAAPDSPQPWLRLAELRLAANDPATAFMAMTEGIKRSPPSSREQLYIDASRLFQSRGASLQADLLLDLAMQAAADPEKSR